MHRVPQPGRSHARLDSSLVCQSCSDIAAEGGEREVTVRRDEACFGTDLNRKYINIVCFKASKYQFITYPKKNKNKTRTKTTETTVLTRKPT